MNSIPRKASILANRSIGYGTRWLAYKMNTVITKLAFSRIAAIMIAAILEKASFVIAVFILYANHRVPYPMLLFASIDAFLGMLFIAVYLTTPSQADS